MAGPVIQVGVPGSANYRVNYGPIVQDRALAQQGIKDIFGGIKTFADNRHDAEVMKSLFEPRAGTAAGPGMGGIGRLRPTANRADTIQSILSLRDPQRRQNALTAIKLFDKTPKFVNLRKGDDVKSVAEGSPAFLDLTQRQGYTLSGDTAAPKKPSAFMEKYELYRRQAEAVGETPLSAFEYEKALRKSGAPKINVGPDAKTLTSDAQRTTRAAVAGQRSVDRLAEPTADGTSLFSALARPEAMIPEWLPGRGYFLSNDFLKAQSAFQEIITEALYLKSGAQAGPAEVASQAAIYMPQPGDGPDVIQEKFQKLKDFVADAQKAAGEALKRFREGKEPYPKQPASAPHGGGSLKDVAGGAMDWATGLFGGGGDLAGLGRFAGKTLEQLKAIPAEEIAKMGAEELDQLEAAYNALAGGRG